MLAAWLDLGRRSLRALPLFAIAACAAPSATSTTADEAPIIGGRRTRGDSAVVAITRNGAPHCTGTVIAPRAVLTAGHCLFDWDLQQLDALFFASDVNAPEADSKRLRFTRGWVHDGYPADPSLDVAIVELEADAPVQPFPIIRTPLDASLVGQSVRLVGYGRTGPGEPAGPKSEVGAVVLELDDRRIVHEAKTCPGDSGGPAFFSVGGREVLVGVHSTGSCGGELPSVKIRVDRNLDFIDGALGLGPTGVANPQVVPPPELPERLDVVVSGAKGSTAQHRLRCTPSRQALAVEVGRGIHAWLRFGAPATPTEFDLEGPPGSFFTTESDGTPFPAGSWYVLVRNEQDFPSAKLVVECL